MHCVELLSAESPELSQLVTATTRSGLQREASGLAFLSGNEDGYNMDSSRSDKPPEGSPSQILGKKASGPNGDDVVQISVVCAQRRKKATLVQGHSTSLHRLLPAAQLLGVEHYREV